MTTTLPAQPPADLSDWPTGPIDVWPLLAADAPPEAWDDQPRDQLGRFATKPGRVVQVSQVPGVAVIGYEAASNYTEVPTERCPHGHFARWAARNCCATLSDSTTRPATRPATRTTSARGARHAR